jgi:NADH-quinone oxidoreductase subunit M
VVALSSIALPGTNGFVGEFLILSGSYEVLPKVTGLATLGVILSAVYMLWMVERVFFGPVKNSRLNGLKDMGMKEALVMAPLIIMIVWMGVKPNFFLKKIELASQTLIERVQSKGSLEALSQR